MQRDVQISEDIFIEDLGTGYSYVNFDRQVSKIVDDETQQEVPVIVAAEQYRVKNPATYDRVVDQVVRENFPDGADQAAVRKGVIDITNADFIQFNQFVESIKVKCKNEGL